MGRINWFTSILWFWWFFNYTIWLWYDTIFNKEFLNFKNQKLWLNKIKTFSLKRNKKLFLSQVWTYRISEFIKKNISQLSIRFLLENIIRTINNRLEENKGIFFLIRLLIFGFIIVWPDDNDRIMKNCFVLIKLNIRGKSKKIHRKFWFPFNTSEFISFYK